MDAASQLRLQEIFRRESRSFLQYIHETTPWSTPQDKPLVVKMHQLAEEELTALEEFAQWLDAQRIPLPYLGAFPTEFSSFNFINIRTLLREVIPRQRKELRQLELDVQALTGEGQVEVNGLVELNRKHLSELTAIGS